jgi:hypothetical protein
LFPYNVIFLKIVVDNLNQSVTLKYKKNRRNLLTKTITIGISKELRKELEKISREGDKPVSDIVRDSLITYLSPHKFRRLRIMIKKISTNAADENLQSVNADVIVVSCLQL